MKLICARCGSEEPLQTQKWRCDCGRPYMLEGVPAFRREAIRSNEQSLWRYRDLLPPFEGDPVTMGEGGTPLLIEEWDGLRLGFKLEFISPSGSFKDRGASLLVSFLRSCGIDDVLDDSSGNAGAALAAYGARGGLHVRIFAPAYTPAAKLVQISSYGAEMIPVQGPRPKATEAALQAVASGAYYATHNYSPFFVEGVATLAYEVLEQLNWEPPDNLLFPMGSGSLVASSYLALTRMRAAGMLDRLPRFFVVQSRVCAPVLQAWENGWEDVRETTPGKTVAEGITIGRPAWGWYALEAVRESGGCVLAVDDSDVLAARDRLARRGLYVEPTSAVPVAALSQLRERIAPSELTVLPLTGHGLKSH